MKRVVYAALLIAVLASLPLPASAQIRPYDFAGTYSMSHDGWRGTLYLGDGGANCPRPLCRSFYTASDGRRFAVRATVSAHQITFYVIGLGGQNTDGSGGQKFHGHLMTQTRNAIAGTTWWEGSPFGFYAIKR